MKERKAKEEADAMRAAAAAAAAASLAAVSVSVRADVGSAGALCGIDDESGYDSLGEVFVVGTNKRHSSSLALDTIQDATSEGNYFGRFCFIVIYFSICIT